MGYTYVSGMCRVCIGYVSGMYRKKRGARDEINDNGDNIALESTPCRATREIIPPTDGTDGHGKAEDISSIKLSMNQTKH